MIYVPCVCRTDTRTKERFEHLRASTFAEAIAVARAMARRLGRRAVAVVEHVDRAPDGREVTVVTFYDAR